MAQSAVDSRRNPAPTNSAGGSNAKPSTSKTPSPISVTLTKKADKGSMGPSAGEGPTEPPTIANRATVKCTSPGAKGRTNEAWRSPLAVTAAAAATGAGISKPGVGVSKPGAGLIGVGFRYGAPAAGGSGSAAGTGSAGGVTAEGLPLSEKRAKNMGLMVAGNEGKTKVKKLVRELKMR